jgi:hypothetical protein
MCHLLAQAMPGEEWTAALLVVTLAGLLAGTIGIYAGSRNSRSPVARRWGVVSYSSGVLSPAFFACVIGRNLTAEGYGLLATPVITGALAIAISYRPPLSLGRRDENRSGQRFR